MKKWLVLSASIITLTGCMETTSGPVQVHMYGVGTGGGSLGIHTVTPADSVYTISKKYNVPMRTMMEMNNLEPPYALVPGMRLKLPAPNTYKSRPGDTLYTISRLYNVSTTDLVKQNHLTAPYTIQPGTLLTLPAPQGPSMQAAAAPSTIPVAPVAVLEPPQVLSEPLPTLQSQHQQSGQQQGGASYVFNPGADNASRLPAEPGKVIAPQTQTASVTAQPPMPTAQEADRAPAKTISKADIPDAPARAGGFQMPVNGKVLSNYGPKADGSHNDGINIQAPKGSAVRAAENGVVVYADNKIEGYGNLVLVRHEDGYITAYAHLDKTLARRGQIVKQGEAIGTVGKSGAVDKPQLHFEIRRGTKALDPKPLLRS